MTRCLATLIVACAMGTPAAAQWLKEPTKGMPRTADGKPDLSAPAPRTADGHPDFSGLWRIDSGAYAGNLLADLKPGDITTAADAVYKQRMEDLGKDDPSTFKCLPQGHRVIYGAGGMARIIQSSTVMAILYENLSYRQIFLDGRTLPADPHPSFMGYSIGRWEGDTLVVETAGFKDATWLDFGGHPHTEALRVVERYRRTSFGKIDLKATFEDPTVFNKPVTIDVKVDFAADTDMLEYVCNENEKSHARMVGKASDDKKNAVKVAREVLSRYVGAYDFRSTEDPSVVITVNVTLSQDELFVDVGGKDPQPMIPLSNTTFGTSGGRLEFVVDQRGQVDHAIFRIVEGDLKGVRK
ncbi:MAG TPA: hypothetical protein VFB92_06825 [Vicinamibacterales bacterium]|nr:hypothetical protein [Vicinamibacterales bacterium]